jgi:hypothetical protein
MVSEFLCLLFILCKDRVSAGTLEIRGGYHKDKKEGNRTSDSHFDQSSYIAVGFTDADICPFEGDPKVTCKSFIEPLPGYGTKKQDYGGNVLHFIPHRVQVFSITNRGDSLNRIANEAVVKRGRERAQFEQQANTSLAELHETLMTGSSAKSSSYRIRHVSSGLFIQPQQNDDASGNISVQLLLGPDLDPQGSTFLFLSNGTLQHIQSGLFVCSSVGIHNNGDALVLIDESGRPEPPSAFDLNDAGSLVHRGSGLYVHPKGGKGCKGAELVLLPGGQDSDAAAEIAFELQRFPATPHVLEDFVSSESSSNIAPSFTAENLSNDAAEDEVHHCADGIGGMVKPGTSE